MTKSKNHMIIHSLLQKNSHHNIKEYLSMLQEVSRIFKECHRRQIINTSNNFNSFQIISLVF